MYDSEGRVIQPGEIGYMGGLDDIAEDLRSGLMKRSPLPESRRAILRKLIEWPECTTQQVADALGLTSVTQRVSEFVAIGYVKYVRRGARIEESSLRITERGREAYEREYQASPEIYEAKYEVYVPPAHHIARAGANDAAKIKSRGT